MATTTATASIGALVQARATCSDRKSLLVESCLEGVCVSGHPKLSNGGEPTTSGRSSPEAVSFTWCSHEKSRKSTLSLRVWGSSGTTAQIFSTSCADSQIIIDVRWEERSPFGRGRGGQRALRAFAALQGAVTGSLGAPGSVRAMAAGLSADESTKASRVSSEQQRKAGSSEKQTQELPWNSAESSEEEGRGWRAVKAKLVKNDEGLPSAAYAIAAALAAASATAVTVKRRERPQESSGPDEVFSGPSDDFINLCTAQLELCGKVLAHGDRLTVYVRTPESYASGLLEMRRVAAVGEGSPVSFLEDTIVLSGAAAGGGDSPGHHSVETALVEHEAVELPERRSLVVPLAKGAFVLGLLVVERPHPVRPPLVLRPKPVQAKKPAWPPSEKVREEDESFVRDRRKDVGAEMAAKSIFEAQEQVAAAQVAYTLALACVMDQKVALLQQATWQKGVLMDSLLEQVRGPLTAFRTLARMLLPQLRQGELSRDMVGSMLEQGDRMRDVVQQLQNALYLAPPAQSLEQAMQYDEGGPAPSLDCGTDVKDCRALSDGPGSSPAAMGALPGRGVFGFDPARLLPGSGFRQQPLLPPPSAKWTGGNDVEAPMPPLTLAPLQQLPDAPGVPPRQSDAAELVMQLLASAQGLARQRQLTVEHLCPVPGSLPLVAADAATLRLALSNILEQALHLTSEGGWVRVEVMRAPGGGVLVVVTDNGLGCNLHDQMQSMAPLGLGLKGVPKVTGSGASAHSRPAPDSYSISRDLVDQLGGVLRVQSPHLPNAPFGFGGTRAEIWLPAVLRMDDLPPEGEGPSGALEVLDVRQNDPFQGEARVA